MAYASILCVLCKFAKEIQKNAKTEEEKNQQIKIVNKKKAQK